MVTHVLRLAEELADEARAPRRLPPGALQPVLQLAVLEVLEVERRRVLHQPQARLVAESLGEQRIEQRDEAAEHVGGDRQPELQRDQPPEAVELAARHPLPKRVVRRRMPGEQHDLVDDELADVERHDGQQRAHDPQRGLTRRQRRARPPDELQERRKVAERPQALAERLALGGERMRRMRPRSAASHRIFFRHAALCRIAVEPVAVPFCY